MSTMLSAACGGMEQGCRDATPGPTITGVETRLPSTRGSATKAPAHVCVCVCLCVCIEAPLSRCLHMYVYVCLRQGYRPLETPPSPHIVLLHCALKANPCLESQRAGFMWVICSTKPEALTICYIGHRGQWLERAHAVLYHELACRCGGARWRGGRSA
jgi:hypothetical protein